MSNTQYNIQFLQAKLCTLQGNWFMQSQISVFCSRTKTTLLVSCCYILEIITGKKIKYV